MKGIEVSLGDYPAKWEAYTAMVVTDRQAIIDLLDGCPNGYFEITMPCGYSQKFGKHEDIPHGDLPCPCGGFGRYLIRYKKE